MKQMMHFAMRRAAGDKPDLLVTNNTGIAGSEAAILEFGFPSSFRHALYDRPFLGFSGALAFIDDMANALRMHEVELARRGLGLGGSARAVTGH
jgi:nitrogenase molybdenum-iron protein alpha/beta subunit